MANVLSLIKSLRLRGGNKAFQRALYLCCRELFDISRDEFEQRWRLKNSDDKGTLRQYMQPTAEALFDEWKRCRDPMWLYSHEEYKWDSIGVSYCQTQNTTTSGVSLLKKAGVSPKRIFDWGAGPGFSSIIMARNFPNAVVHYNECNLELISVFEWFRSHAKVKNVKFVSEPDGKYDIVQAYEIVEHFAHTDIGRFKAGIGDPMTETDKLLKTLDKGSYFLHSSCWSAENNFFTLGHFLRSEIDGQIFNNTRVGSGFRKALARRGWAEIGAGWNSRPFLFKRVE